MTGCHHQTQRKLPLSGNALFAASAPTLRMRGKIAGSPVENGGSGFVRVKSALAVLQRNKWFEAEQTVGELRIRLGERARKLNEQPAFAPDLQRGLSRI